MIISPIKTRIFVENESITDFIKDHVSVLPEKSVLVITSKIVALAEGRTCVAQSKKEKEDLIREESDIAIKTRYTWLTLKNGHLTKSAGIDESNADGKMILLPENSYASAKRIRTILKEHYDVTDLGIVITDSRILPLRKGALGEALGYAGIEGIKKYKGSKDLFDRTMQSSTTNIPDSLAASAVLTMGEGSESQPLALINDAPISFTDRETDPREIMIAPHDDVYKPFFTELAQPSRLPKPLKNIFISMQRLFNAKD